MARSPQPHIKNLADLLAFEAQLDRSICGTSLNDQDETRLAEEGAHDPTPTHYFVLEHLFKHFTFDEDSRLLDVGCGTGRVLAFFVLQGFPGHATGIELDPELASSTAAWASRHRNLTVLQGSALDLDLSPYTPFYLFNPFDPNVLERFILALEEQLTHPFTLIHMSDNGDTWRYVGRPGWSEVASGSIKNCQNDRGHKFSVYEWPQHYTVWHYDGARR